MDGTINLTIDPNREGVKLDFGISEIHLYFRRHAGKLVVSVEKVGEALVVTKTIDPPISGKVD